MSKKTTKAAIAAAITEAPANPAIEAATKSNEKPKRVVKPATRKPPVAKVLESATRVEKNKAMKRAELEARIEGPKDETPAKPEAKRPDSWVLSSTDKPTKKVWAVADSMPGATRKEVIAACIAQGIAPGTSRTQYQAWFKAMRDSGKPVR